jgi:hypothetical protein
MVTTITSADADQADPATAPTPEDLRTAADPVNTVRCDPAVAWTTGNVAEAFPGVFTALGFSFTHEPMELAFRTMFHRLGVFTEAELTVPPRVEDQFWTAFEGRAAANLDQFHRVASLTPGTSASAVEKQLFGYVRDTTRDANSPRRYPLLAVKAPRTIATLPKRHDALFARLRGWRRQQLPKIDRMDERSCLDLIADARGRFRTIMVEHLVVAFVSSGLADRLAAMVEAADLPGLEARLLSGVGSDEKALPGVVTPLARWPTDPWHHRELPRAPDVRAGACRDARRTVLRSLSGGGAQGPGGRRPGHRTPGLGDREHPPVVGRRRHLRPARRRGLVPDPGA